MPNKIKMFTDGGSRGNPGPAGIGVWIETLNKEHKEYIGKKTNNEAEYEALIKGLKKIKQIVGNKKAKNTEVDCFLDSELVVRQLNHKYKLKEEHIQKYFIEVWNLMLDFLAVKFYHIGREKNKIADKLANEAMDGKLKQGSLL